MDAGRGFQKVDLCTGRTDLTAEHAGIIFIAGLLLYLLSVAIHYLFAAAETSRDAERRVLEAEVAARDAELQALKAQLNPHFLFNSLNSVASLAATDPAGARDMCIQLGDYLRGTLKSGSGLQPLGEELAQVRRFLRVESVRYGDRLRVAEEIDDRCLGVAVPPLLLQPLVENALKHGIAELVEGGEVRIGARCSGELLTVWVENPGRCGEPAKIRGGRRARQCPASARKRLRRRGQASKRQVRRDLPGGGGDPGCRKRS